MDKFPVLLMVSTDFRPRSFSPSARMVLSSIKWAVNQASWFGKKCLCFLFKSLAALVTPNEFHVSTSPISPFVDFVINRQRSFRSIDGKHRSWDNFPPKTRQKRKHRTWTRSVMTMRWPSGRSRWLVFVHLDVVDNLHNITEWKSNSVALCWCVYEVVFSLVGITNPWNVPIQLLSHRFYVL